jgi:hypothetical protein
VQSAQSNPRISAISTSVALPPSRRTSGGLGVGGEDLAPQDRMACAVEIYEQMERPMKTPRLPETDSIEELARFWDTHDLTDFEDQLEEVNEPVFRRGSTASVNIRLAPAEIEAVERLARSTGSDLGGLLHDWVVEKLNEVLGAR